MSRQAIPVTGDPVGQEALENLRAYILFLEGMDAKYLSNQSVEGAQDRRVRRTIEAAFSDDVESLEEES